MYGKGKNRMRKKGISFKVIAVLSILALFLLLIPMLNAAKYNVPSEDDYPNGLQTHFVWEATHSLTEVAKVAWDRVYDLYFSWQGTFSAIFLFTLNPMIFGEQYYQIGAWLILGMLIAGIFSLTITVAKKIFGASSYESLIIAAVWTVICTQFLPRASQGFYWFTGAVYYTFFFGAASVAFSVLLSFLFRGKDDRGIGKLIAASILFFLIGGGNLVTGLTTMILLLSLELLLIFLRKSDWKLILIPVLSFGIGFGINVAAPGNFLRQKYFEQPGLIQSVFLSFQEAGKAFLKWFSLPVIAIILLLVPVFLKVASRTKFRFVFPGLITLYSICLTAVMFYPPIYAEGPGSLKSLSRLTNIIFYGMAGLVIINLFYWTGWLIQRGTVPEKWFPCAGNGRYSVIWLTAVLLVFGFGMTRIQWFDTTSISAFRSYRSGEMGNYMHTYKQQLAILKDPEIKDAVLKRFPCRPYVLYYREFSENAEENTVAANWYGKTSVISK